MENIFGSRKNLLNAATAAGPSPASLVLALNQPYSVFTMRKTVGGTGAFSALVTDLEGSLDGSAWFQLGTDNTLTSSTTFVVDKPVLYLRANVTTATVGSLVPTVSVDVVGCV